MKKNLFRLFLFLLFAACKNPAEFKHANIHDPQNKNFTPDPPADIALRIEGRRLKMTWRDRSDYEDGYLIERALDAGFDFVELKKLPPNATAFADTIDFAAFAPSYRISAFSLDGAQLHKFDTRAIAVVLNKPYALFSELLSEQQIRISWRDTITFETGFEVERQIGAAPFTKIATLPANTTEFFDNATLTNGASYTHRVRAVNNAQLSPYDVTYPTAFNLPPPDSLKMQPISAGSVMLFWRQSEPLATTFVIERLQGAIRLEVGRVNAAVKKFQLTGLDTLQQYQYQIRTLTSSPSTPIAIVYKKGMYPIHHLVGHEDIINDIDFSPDGKLLATGGADRTARIWDSQTGRLLATLRGPRANLNTLDFSPDGQILATGSGESSCCVSAGVNFWNVPTGTLIRRVSSENIYQLEFHPNGQALAINDFGSIGLYQTLNGQPIVRAYYDSLGQHSVNAMSLHPGGNMIAIGNGDARARIFETMTGKLLHRFPAGSYYDGPRAVLFSRNGNILATGIGGTVKLWEMSTYNLIREWMAQSNTIYSLAFSPDSRRLVTASLSDRAAKVWDANTGNFLASLEIYGHALGVSVVAFSADNQTIATGSWDKTVKLWREGWRWVENR